MLVTDWRNLATIALRLGDSWDDNPSANRILFGQFGTVPWVVSQTMSWLFGALWVPAVNV